MTQANIHDERMSALPCPVTIIEILLSLKLTNRLLKIMGPKDSGAFPGSSC